METNTSLPDNDTNVTVMLNEFVEFSKQQGTPIKGTEVEYLLPISDIFRVMLETPLKPHGAVIQLTTCSFVCGVMEDVILFREIFADGMLETGVPLTKRERLYLEILLILKREPARLAQCIVEIVSYDDIENIVHDKIRNFELVSDFFDGLPLDKTLFIPEFFDKYKEFPYMIEAFKTALRLETFSHPSSIRTLAASLDNIDGIGEIVARFGTAIDTAIVKDRQNCIIDFSIDYRIEIMCIKGDMWIRTEEDSMRVPERTDFPELAYIMFRALEALGNSARTADFDEYITIFK